MTKAKVGITLIIAGVFYGLQVFDFFYYATLGKLVDYGIVEPPKIALGFGKNGLDRKPKIVLYSLIFIIVGSLLIVADYNNA